MSKKIKIFIYVVCTLWIVVFAQIMLTKVFVKGSSVTQAFARNQLMVEQSSEKVQEICQKGGWIMGTIPGKIDLEEKQRLAGELFGYEGGACLFEEETPGYYIAYGYTSGIDLVRVVNGKRINMNVAVTYDEEEDKSRVYFGVPFLNLDF